MAELPNVDELIRSNPNIDPRQLEKGRELLRKLRESGARGAGYRLASPINRRRVLIGGEPTKDSRIVQLRNRS